MSYKKLEIWQISRELVTLFETESLKNAELYNNFHNRLDILGKKINLFLQAIERSINNK